MAISEQQFTEELRGGEEENHIENGGSDTESYDSDDSQDDPTFNILEETQAGFSNLSIKKKSRIGKDMDMGSGVDPDEVEMIVPELHKKDEQSFEKVQKFIEAGQLEKLKVDQCKVYLRKNGLRLTGNKDTLIQRIKEHLEIINGGGEKKYPVSSFVLNCKGDACTGDIVMFEQNVYEMFNIASRSASGPPCGTRIVAGRIVKESYGAAKQQHTFTIEVLWSKGEKALPPLHPLLIKGRNLYRLKTLRQRWEDEGERQKALMEKHSRGSLARSEREARIQEKEMHKMLKVTRVSRKEKLTSNQSQLNPVKSGLSTDSGKTGVQCHQNQMQNNYQNQNCKLQHSKPTFHTFQPHSNLTECWSSSTHQENIKVDPLALIKFLSSSNIEKPSIGIQEAKHQRVDEFQFHPNPYPNASGLSEMTDHWQPLTSMNHYPSMGPNQRQPLKSMNHYPSTNPTQRQPLTSIDQYAWQRPGHMQRQPCQYYAQGRCYFGDNCKFLHELREERGQRREDRW